MKFAFCIVSVFSPFSNDSYMDQTTPPLLLPLSRYTYILTVCIFIHSIWPTLYQCSLVIRVAPCACICLSLCRPNMEKTGEVSDCGASLVKHALNPDKTFMQVHYLKVRRWAVFLPNICFPPAARFKLAHFCQEMWASVAR